MNEIYLAYFATFSVVMGTALPWVIELLNRLMTLENKYLKHFVSWTVPAAIMYAGWFGSNFFDGSFLQELAWWKPGIYGIWAGLMANIEWNNVPWLKDAVNNFFDWVLSK